MGRLGVLLIDPSAFRLHKAPDWSYRRDSAVSGTIDDGNSPFLRMLDTFGFECVEERLSASHKWAVIGARVVLRVTPEETASLLATLTKGLHNSTGSRPAEHTLARSSSESPSQVLFADVQRAAAG